MVYLQQFDSYTAEHQSFMVTVGFDGTVLGSSDGLKSSLGYEQADVTGKNLVEFIDERLHSAIGFWVESMHKDQGDKNRYTSLIVPLIAKDGSERIFSLLVRPTNLSGKDIYLVVAESGLESADQHDKKVISKIKKRNRQQREGWDFIVNSKGVITDSSGKSRLGYEKEEVLNKNFTDFIKSDKLQIDQISNNLQLQTSFILTLSFKNKDSKEVRCKTCFAPDFLADPGSPAFIVSFRPLMVEQDSNTSQTSVA